MHGCVSVLRLRMCAFVCACVYLCMCLCVACLHIFFRLCVLNLRCCRAPHSSAHSTAAMNMFRIIVIPLAVVNTKAPPLDEARVSVLDWTDAHTLAYESTIVGVTVSKEEAAVSLSLASDDFLCMQNIIGQTALHLAVRQDHLEIVELYARRVLGLDIPNKDGDTPLHYAAFHNRPRAAELLLKAGASCQASNDKGERHPLPMRERRSRYLLHPYGWLVR